MPRNKIRLLLAFNPHALYDRPYTVKEVYDTVEFNPGDQLLKSRVKQLCESMVYTVKIVQEKI